MAEPGHEAADVLHVLDGVGAARREVRERRVEQLADVPARVGILEAAQHRLRVLEQQHRPLGVGAARPQRASPCATTRENTSSYVYGT